MARKWLYLEIVLTLIPVSVLAQSQAPAQPASLPAAMHGVKTQENNEMNRRLQQLVRTEHSNPQEAMSSHDYRIGPDDLLAISVLDAPDLSHPVRVTADGNISIPLLGSVKAAGLTSHQLATALANRLRGTYMRDPQVTVAVTQMESHSVSVLGAVKKPGVFQIRGTKTLLEMLSMAEGLAPDAGDAVLVMRGATAEATPQAPGAPASSGQETKGASGDKPTVEISLKRLLDSGDAQYNVPVYPGDIVKVKAAGIVYVVGDVKRPGGFPVKDNEHITVLQAIALGEGITPTAAKSRATIIRVAQNGQQIEIPVPLNKILTGKSPDLPLRPKDILFVPKSGAKSAGRAALETFARWVVWRGIP